ncbi:Ca2+-dependent phosphoinositide-specific phospholipase C [Streptosporangium canum]
MITRTRLGVFLAATLGTAFTSVVAPTAVLAQQSGQTATSASTTADSGKIRMNQIQFMGAPNSFHREMQSVEPAESIKIDPGYPSWGFYSHAFIADLLGRQNVRALELDLLPDPDGGLYQYMYLDGHPSLQDRAVFTRGNPGDADAAITMVNDPRGANEATIQDLVKRGYIVRTRSDEPLKTVVNSVPCRLPHPSLPPSAGRR